VVDIEGSETILLEQPADFPAGIRAVLIELHPGIYGEEKKQLIIGSIIREGFALTNEEDNVFLFQRAAR
jgi:hypothetical protein